MVYQEVRQLVLSLWCCLVQNTFWHASLQIHNISNNLRWQQLPELHNPLGTLHQSTGQEKHLGYQSLWAACPPLQHWARAAEPVQLLRCQLQLSSTLHCNTQLLCCSMTSQTAAVSRKDSITRAVTTKSASTNCFPLKGQKLFATEAIMLRSDSEFQTGLSHKHSHLSCAILFQRRQETVQA